MKPVMKHDAKKLPDVTVTRTGLLARNVIWNLLGTGAPVLVAIVAIPILIEGLGEARFGVLTLAWMVVGYFSLFDLGLGRALTKLVAEKLGDGKKEELPTLVWTAMLLMAALGVLGSIAVALLSPWLVAEALKIPTELQHETLISFYLLAGSIPVVISTSGLRGILEAHQRFGLINAVRIPLGVLTFLGPIAVLPFSHSLVSVIATLVIARLLSGCAYVALCLYVEPTLRYPHSIQSAMLKPLLNFGGWMTVTNIVGPLMVYLDRFLIGSVVSITAVTYYVTPYEIVSKLSIFSGAFMGVMFPAFSAAVVNDRGHAAFLFHRTIKFIFLALFPIILVFITLAHEGLTLWINPQFADNSTLVLRLLAIGVFLNSFAQVPFGLIQSLGRPDLTAKLHLIELPFYLLLLWWLVGSYGITGAAIAWVVRVGLDALFLFFMAERLLPLISVVTPQSLVISIILLFILIMSGLISNFTIKLIFLLMAQLLFVAAAWLVILTKEEKKATLNYLKSLFTKKKRSKLQ